MKERIAHWIHNHLGDEWGGSASPPGSNQSLEFGEFDTEIGKMPHLATTYNNDGCELWLHTEGVGWRVFYRAPAARRLAWFILWDWWAKGTWFGLKRWIWYQALHVIVEGYKKYKPIDPNNIPRVDPNSGSQVKRAR